MKLSTKEKRLALTVFLIYLFLLIWLVLFKLRIEPFPLRAERTLNLIPLKASFYGNGKPRTVDLMYNILAFIPLGVYVNIFFERWKSVFKLIPAFCFSLALEAIQYFTRLGVCDVTDLINNTLGGCLGVLLCIWLFKKYGERALNIINKTGLTIDIIGVLAPLALPVADMFNM